MGIVGGGGGHLARKHCKKAPKYGWDAHGQERFEIPATIDRSAVRQGERAKDDTRAAISTTLQGTPKSKMNLLIMRSYQYDSYHEEVRHDVRNHTHVKQPTNGIHIYMNTYTTHTYIHINTHTSRGPINNTFADTKGTHGQFTRLASTWHVRTAQILHDSFFACPHAKHELQCLYDKNLKI